MSDEVYLLKLKNGQITQFNIKTRKTLFTTEVGHTHQIQRTLVHPNNADLMASGGFDGTLRKWDLKNMQMESMFEDRGKEGKETVIQAIAWCKMIPPKGKPADSYEHLIIIGTSAGTLKLIDLNRNRVLKSI